MSDISFGASGLQLEWNRFENFINTFTVHPTFNEVLTTSIMNILIDVPLIIFFSLFIALFLNQTFRGRTLARAIFFFPVILGAPAISSALTMAQAMMLGGVAPASAAVMESSGSDVMVNVSYYLYMLGNLAIPPTIIEYIIGAVGRINNIIISSGVQIVIFLAALQTISPTVYEAAKIEGATPYETFWLITFPMVSPLILTNVVYTIIDSFSSSPVVTLSYNTVFFDFNYGLGTVFALVSSIAIGIVLATIVFVLNRSTYYYT
jgi:ABC-type sugar transport system permease subunit